MAHEIAGVIGSSGSGGGGNNGHSSDNTATTNGRLPVSASGTTNGSSPSSAAALVNGLLNGRPGSNSSRDQSPVNNHVINQQQQQPTLSKDELRRVRNLNQNMRQLIYKEVKRPGKNHEKLFDMLKKDLHGPRHVRR